MKQLIIISCMVLFLIATSCSGDQNKNDLVDTTKTDSVATENIPEASKFSYGVDISSHQGNEIEILDKNKDSLTFVICRATDGITFTDVDFKKNWPLISEKGFVRGAYHFFESNDNPQSQATNYLNVVSDLNTSDLPPIVDFEGGGIRESQPVEDVQDNLLKLLEILEEKTGRLPILYTNINDGNKYLDKAEFAKYTLWIADYTEHATPTLPGAWKGSNWVFWQKTDDYMNAGVKNDFDIFNGSSDAFSTFLEQQ